MKKINHILIAVSVLLIILGLALMYGSRIVLDFKPDIFSFRRITLAPVLCVIGFVLMIVGIMYKPKK